MNKTEKLQKFRNVLDRVDKGLNRLIKASLVSALIVVGHFGYLPYELNHSPKITSQELAEASKEEIKKLGLENTPIKVEFFDKTKHRSLNTSYCTFDDKIGGSCLVVLHPEQENRGVLRHELYHIKAGHLLNQQYRSKSSFRDSLLNTLEEYRANIYAVHDLQL